MASKPCACLDCSIGQPGSSTPVNDTKCLCRRPVSRLARLKQKLFKKGSKKSCSNSYLNLSHLDDYPFQVRRSPSDDSLGLSARFDDSIQLCDDSMVSDWSVGNTTAQSADPLYADHDFNITADVHNISMVTSPVHVPARHNVTIATSDKRSVNQYYTKTISRRLKNFQLNLRTKCQSTRTLAVF